MACQFGVFNSDDQPASVTELATPSGYPDAKLCFQHGSIALGYVDDLPAHAQNNRDYYTHPDECTLTFVGQLHDNSGATHISSAQPALFINHLYCHKGANAFAQLIGEYAFCLWSGRDRSLYLSRSLSGNQPLYFVSQAKKLRWSSSFAHLVRWTGISLDVNDRYVLEYLVGQPTSSESPLRHVQVVPPNSILRFENAELHSSISPWRWSSLQPLVYKNDEAYEQHCREVIKQAVARRISATGPICAELSGGLDSSTVVLVADQILRERNEDPDRLKTVSYTFETSTTSDETRFIALVEQKRGHPSIYIREHEQRATLGLRQLAFTGVPSPLDCFPGRHESIADHMRRCGASILLTGIGGDHLFWSSSNGSPAVADLLGAGRLLSAHQLCSAWSFASRIPYVELMFTSSLPLILPPFIQQFVRPLLLPSWISTDKRKKLRSYFASPSEERTVSSWPSRKAQLSMVHSLIDLLSAGYFSQVRKMYLTHPYSDQSLIEFCLSLPISQLIRPGETRSIMRRAFRDLLPPAILKRKTKAGPEEVFLRALRNEWDDIGNVREWQLAQRGFIEPGTLSLSLQQSHLGVELPNEVLVRVFSLERWLRSLDTIVPNNIYLDIKDVSIEVRPIA